jgi:Flp pilus assembly CpaF family ATPase
MSQEELVIDRDVLLTALKDAAIDPASRNILLAGPWGSGKTTLLDALKE